MVASYLKPSRSQEKKSFSGSFLKGGLFKWVQWVSAATSHSVGNALCVQRCIFSTSFQLPSVPENRALRFSKSHSRCLGCPISSWRILGAHLGLPKKLVAPCLFTSVAVLCITVLEVLLQKEYPHWTECQNVSYLSILFCHKKTKLLPASSYSPAHFKLLHHPGGFVVQHKKSCSN